MNLMYFVKTLTSESLCYFLLLFFFIFWNDSSASEIETCININNITSSQQDAWWISNAVFINIIKHQEIKRLMDNDISIESNQSKLFSLTDHLLMDGNGNILIYRDFNKGWSSVSDSSELIQITIYTPETLKNHGELIVGKSSGLIVFYTSGIPGLREYDFGYAIRGKITYRMINPQDKKIGLFSRLGIEKGIWALISLEFITFDQENESKRNIHCLFGATLIFKPQTISFTNATLK